MTIKTEINGQSFEIELADGLNVEFSAGKIKVAKTPPLRDILIGDNWPSYPLHPLPQPYAPVPMSPTIPCVTWCDTKTSAS